MSERPVRFDQTIEHEERSEVRYAITIMTVLATVLFVLLIVAILYFSGMFTA